VDTRELILEGARVLFFKYGIKSVTMDDIAKHLGMSKKTIYQFFEDKSEVIKTLIEKTMSSNRCEFDDIGERSQNAVEEMWGMMIHLGAMFSKMNPNLFYDLQKYHPESWQLFRNFKEKFILETVEKNIKKGIKEGLFRKDIKIKIIARLRIEQIEFAMNPLTFPPDQYNLAEVQMTLLDHYLHGIATIKGHKLINKFKEVVEED
jgi:AcrR family transcriptional regulator